MRWKQVGVACVVMLWLVLLTAKTSAHEIFQGDQCVIDSDTVIEGDVLVLCRALQVDGTIEGSLIGAAITAEINGSVRDDVYIAAGQLDVRGVVGDDILFGGPVLQIHPTTVFEDEWGHLISLSLSSRVFDGARVPASVTSISYQLLIDGEVGRDVSFWGSALRVDGTVQGNIDATVGDSQSGDASQLQTLLAPFRFEVDLIDPGLLVTEDGQIDGQLRYTAPGAGEINGTLENEASFTPIVTVPDLTQIDFTDEDSVLWFNNFLGGALREFVSLTLIGVLGLTIVPRAVQSPLQNLRWRPLNSIGVGILTFFMSFVIWIVVLLLLVLLVVIFLLLTLGDLVIVALMSFGLLNVGATSIFYFVAFYVSRVLVALAFGRVLVRLLIGDDGSQRILYISLVVGAALLALLMWLPVVGWVFNALALVLGLGAVVLTLASLQARARTLSQPTAVSVPGRVMLTPDVPPPPIIDTKPNTPGMDNLPKGFRWWNEDD
jgi:hypothetical protein